MKNHKTILMSLAACLLTSTAQAATTTIGAINSGWFAHDGLQYEYNSVYAVGGGLDGLTRHDYFSFDLDSLQGAITSAQLKIFNPGTPPSIGQPFGYTSQDASETFRLYDVSTGHVSLFSGYDSGSADGQAIFADLGSGIVYGEYVASVADNGHRITIDLNADAIAALNNRSGRIFSFGGSITTLDDAVNRESLFVAGYNLTGWVDLVTVTTPVPEPQTFALWLAGLALVGRVARRKA